MRGRKGKRGIVRRGMIPLERVWHRFSSLLASIAHMTLFFLEEKMQEEVYKNEIMKPSIEFQFWKEINFY